MKTLKDSIYESMISESASPNLVKLLNKLGTKINSRVDISKVSGQLEVWLTNVDLDKVSVVADMDGIKTIDGKKTLDKVWKNYEVSLSTYKTYRRKMLNDYDTNNISKAYVCTVWSDEYNINIKWNILVGSDYLYVGGDPMMNDTIEPIGFFIIK